MKTGKTPQLISYRTDVIIKKTHDTNGKAFLVPNIVHLISFGTGQPFMFYNYIAYKSFQKFIQPHAIILWADYLPSTNSTWWNQTLQEVANIYFMQTKPTVEIGGKKVIFAAHAADYLRMQLILGTYRYMPNVTR